MTNQLRDEQQDQIEIVRQVAVLLQGEQLVKLVNGLATLDRNFKREGNVQMRFVRAGIEKFVALEVHALNAPDLPDGLSEAARAQIEATIREEFGTYSPPMLFNLDATQTVVVKEALISYLKRASMYLESAKWSDAFEDALTKFHR